MSKDTKQPDTVKGLTVTLNQMGYMLNQPDLYNQAFIDFATKVRTPCLEIGAAYGVAAIPALTQGATIIANDLSAEHLEILKDQVPHQDLPRLTLKPGRFPEELQFPENSFAGILISRVLHFIQPELLSQCMNQLFQWLQPGGSLFVVVSSPYTQSYQKFFPLYKERKESGQAWPGLLTDIPQFAPDHAPNMPGFIHFIDEDLLRNLLEAAGFEIQKMGFSSIHMDSCGTEQIGAIAIKPQTSI